jgi:hypothetical protein
MMSSSPERGNDGTPLNCTCFAGVRKPALAVAPAHFGKFLTALEIAFRKELAITSI